MIQPAVLKLQALGPLPASHLADIELLQQFEVELENIQVPITPDDAEALVKLFGPDECFGLGWTLLHKLEKAPAEVLDSSISKCPQPYWRDLLSHRAE